jgi:hypothetical protein
MIASLQELQQLQDEHKRIVKDALDAHFPLRWYERRWPKLFANIQVFESAEGDLYPLTISEADALGADLRAGIAALPRTGRPPISNTIGARGSVRFIFSQTDAVF